MLKARCYMGVLHVATLAFFIYLGLYTSFWRGRIQATVIYVAMTLVVDAVLIEPLIIFAKTFVGYVFCEMTNTVYDNVWNMDRETSLEFSKNPGWNAYVEKASADEHRPLLGSELAKKRRGRQVARISLLSLMYLIAFTYEWNLYLTGNTKMTLSKYAYRVMTIEAESGEKVDSWLGEPPVTVGEVVDVRTARMWVGTVFAKVLATWKNGKRISSDGRYWDSSGYSLPQAVTKMITLYYTRNASEKGVVRAKAIRGVQGVQFGRGRRLAGRYTESTQETRNVIVNGQRVGYEVLSSWIRTSGKSGQSYPLAGHSKEFRLFRDSWASYYAQVRQSMEVIFSRGIIIREDLDLVPRAILLLRNSLVPNMMWLSTIDAVIEYLPEGICLATLHIELNDIVDATGSRILRTVNAILLMTLLAINCCILCDLGFRKYFTTLYFSLTAAFLLICFLATVASVYTGSLKVAEANNVIEADGVFTVQDYNRLAHDRIITCLYGLCALIVTFQTVVILRHAFKYERMARAFARCFYMILTGMIMLATAIWVSAMHLLPLDVRYIDPLLYRFYFKELFFANIGASGEYRHCRTHLAFLVAGFFLLNNYFKALVVCLNERVELPEAACPVRLSQCGLVKRWRHRNMTAPPKGPAPTAESSSSTVHLDAPSSVKSKLSEKVTAKHALLTKVLLLPTAD